MFMEPFLNKKILFFTAVALPVCMLDISSAKASSNDSLEKFGDIAQIAIPAIGLGATAFYGDLEGTKQWAWSGVTTIGTTTVMKGVYQKIRPNGAASATSFPSGHTAAAFFGAAFLDQRYGKWWGIPAYTAAAVTAYSRVLADHHFVDDTLMATSIAMMSSWYWVTPHDGAVSLVPFQQNDAYGVTFHFNGNGKQGDYSGLNDDERWRYSIVFGPAAQQKNQVTAPIGSGTEFDLNNFQKTNDPTTTANVMIERYAGRHLTQFSVAPFEARDTGQFSQATSFKGTTYLPGEEIRSAYRLLDIRVQYFYDLLPDSKIILQAGGGLSFQHTVVDIATTDGVKSETARSDVWIPLVNATLGYEFTPRLSVVTELSGLSITDQKQLDVSLSLGYRLDKYWDAGIGYGIYRHDTSKGELRSNVEYDVIMTYVGYSFY